MRAGRPARARAKPQCQVWLEVATPRAIQDLFECGLTAIEVVVDWLTVVLAVEGAFITSQLLRAGGFSRPAFNMAPYVPFAVATLVVLLLDRDGAYRAGNSLLRIKETERSLRVSVQAFALILPIAFLVGGAVPRAIFVIAMAGVPFLQIFEKQLFFLGVRALRARGYGVRNVVIYGAGESGRRIFSALVRSPRLGLNPVALVDDDAALDGQDVFASGYRRRHAVRIVAGPVTEQLLEHYACALFVIAIPGLERERFSRAVKAAEGADAAVTFLPRDSAFSLGGIEHADIDGILLNAMRKPEGDWSYEIAKRVFDRLGAVALLVLVAPAWLVIAFVVHFDSPGPVLFRHERVGMRGRFFTLFKLLAVHRALGTWNRCVTQFIALSEFARARFIAGGIDASRIAVKANFVDPDPGIGTGKGGFALFAGRLVEEKGIEVLLEAWKGLAARVRLKVIGEGPLAQRVAKAAAADTRIEWLGSRSQREVLETMRDAAILVFPSTWYEGFPLVLAEALATGLPVVASRLGAMEEIIEDGITGRLFFPGDADAMRQAVTWVFSHPDQMSTMRLRARAAFDRKYTAETNYARMMTIYETALGCSPELAGAAGLGPGLKR